MKIEKTTNLDCFCDFADGARIRTENGDSRRYDGDDSCTSTLDEFPDIDQHHPGRYVNPDAPITDTMQRQLDEVLAFEDLCRGTN